VNYLQFARGIQLAVTGNFEFGSVATSQGAASRRRLIVCLALAVLLFRAFLTFVAPQLWAEDGVLYQTAYNLDWHALLIPINGYLKVFSVAVALVATKSPPILAPWIEVYSAHAAALLIVWMVTSPRFDMPHKEIAALGVVCAPGGFEVLGFLANTQWVLPLGLFVLVFSRPSKIKSIIAFEAIFIAIVGLEGPVGLFFIPVFLLLTFSEKGAVRQRLAILSIALLMSAALQILSLYFDHSVLDMVTSERYPASLWFTLPARWLDATWPISALFGFDRRYVFPVFFTLILGFWFSLREPYRKQKLAMLFIAATILFSGMYKYRHALGIVAEQNGRYFYAGSVFFYWFLCIAADTLPRMRYIILTATTFTLLNGAWFLVLRAYPPVPWTTAAARVGHGPLSIPISPSGWNIDLQH
jgi:hypothetical protein